MSKSHDPPTAPYDYSETRTTVSDQQIAQSAYNAGFRGPALVTAIAVALGESHGNTTALNDRHEFSVGLWQINVHGYLGDRLRKLGFTSWTDLYDPDKNARAAYLISNGGKKFGAWSIYKHNAHLRYMDRATIAAANVNQPSNDGDLPPLINDVDPHDAGVPVSTAQIGIAPVSIGSTWMLEIMIVVLGIVIVSVLIKTRSNG